MSVDTSSALTAPARARRKPRANPYAKAFSSPKGRLGAILLVVLCLLALAAPLIFPQGYDLQTPEALQAPSWAHWFGTDQLGRDILASSIYGLRIDVSLILLAVPASMLIGTLLGLSGLISETLGTVIQRALDLINGFPNLILGMVIVLLIGPGWFSLFILIFLYGLPSAGRLARSVLLEQRGREYVIAAELQNVPKRKILTRHIMPHAVDPIIANGAMYMAQAIFIEAGMSIIGLGIQPPEPALGALMNQGMRYIFSAPAYVVGPMVLLFLLAFSFTLLADALNEAIEA